MTGSSPATEAQRSGSPGRLAIATPQRAATEAGVEAFAAGGNALDACLAAAISLAVIYPDNCSLGGDMIALIGRQDGARLVVNASGPAAKRVEIEALRRSGARMPLRGVASVTVPGVIAGLSELWCCGALLGWDRAFASAIAQAREGVPVVPSLARSILGEEEMLFRDAGCREVFFRGASPLREGDSLHQPALARTLECLAADGPEAFYHGSLGRRLIECLRSHGSLLDLSDLARFVPERTPPHVRSLGSAELVTAPPNSQGFLLPLILSKALEVDSPLDPLGPEAGRLAGLFRAATALREERLADPLTMKPGQLERFDRFDLLPPAGSPSPMPPATGDTVAIVAVDDAGNSVSLLHSVFCAFGAGILDPRTGILLHNRGACFSLDPRSPNVIAAGKRPAHTLTPCMLVRDGVPEVVIATMGGSAQPQILTEILLRLHLGDSPEAALEAPRWTLGSTGDAPDRVWVEERVPEPARRSLEGSGFPVEFLPGFDDHLGHAQLIVCDGNSFTAVSDPRSEGAAAVVQR